MVRWQRRRLVLVIGLTLTGLVPPLGGAPAAIQQSPNPVVQQFIRGEPDGGI